MQRASRRRLLRPRRQADLWTWTRDVDEPPRTVTGQWPGASPVPENYSKGYKAIQPDLCKKWLTFLSTQCEGRGSGQPGFQKAADYMAARFKEFGLKPIGVNGTYFQPVPFAHWRDNPKESSLELVDKKLKIDFTKDLSVSNTTTEFDSTAPIAFIRSNGKNAELPDDKSVKGKLLIVFANDLGKLRTQLALSDAVGILYVTEGFKPAVWSAERRSAQHLRREGHSVLRQDQRGSSQEACKSRGHIRRRHRCHKGRRGYRDAHGPPSPGI